MNIKEVVLDKDTAARLFTDSGGLFNQTLYAAPGGQRLYNMELEVDVLRIERVESGEVWLVPPGGWVGVRLEDTAAEDPGALDEYDGEPVSVVGKQKGKK